MYEKKKGGMSFWKKLKLQLGREPQWLFGSPEGEEEPVERWEGGWRQELKADKMKRD